MLITDGGVAELVDALDSKSCFLWKYEFKSHHPYQSKKAPAGIAGGSSLTGITL